MKWLLATLITTSVLVPMTSPEIVSQMQVQVPESLIVERIAGKDRYETAVAISRKLEFDGNKVVLASGENFPDGLSAGLLANHIGGVLLLTEKEGLPQVVQEELSRIEPDYTAVIGGEGTIADYGSKYIQESEVIYGSNRYETSIKVAERMPAKELGYASGENFADALVAGPLLNKLKMPLVLVDGSKELRGEGIFFGGSQLLRKEETGSLRRISGKNRYETSVMAAKAYGDFDTVIMVSGEDYADALAAMPLAKRYDAPILLSRQEGLPKEVMIYLMDEEVKHFILVGGENALSEKVEKQLQEIDTNNVRYTLLTSPIKPGQYASEVKEAVATYHEQKRDYKDGSRDYDPKGIFLDFDNPERYGNSDNIELDEDGLPKVRYRDEFHYNPVTMAQYALSEYGAYMEGGEVDGFLKATDKLIDMMDAGGAFRYTFPWKNGNTGEVYEKGWISAMAQGHGLSCFSRAYHITKDPKYIEAGKKCYSFLILDKLQGGTMTSLADLDERLSDQIFFEEYVSNPSSYTLNGYMFTLLGIYDWKILTEEFPEEVGENSAADVFNDGIESLLYILHLYDVGGFTNYDLGYMNFDVKPRLIPGYHAVHIRLLHSLYSITGVERLKAFEMQWRSYVD